MSLQHLTDRYRSQLQQRKAHDAQTLTTAHTQAVQQIQPHLDALYQEVTTKLEDVTTVQEEEATAKIPLSWLHEGGKLAALKQFIADRIDHFSGLAKMVVNQVQHWGMMLGSQVASVFMKNAKRGFAPEPAKPSVLSRLLDGAKNKVSDLFSLFGREAAQGVDNALVLGLSLGSTVQEIAGKVAQVLDVPRWRAVAIAATELFRSYNDTLMAGYGANAPLIPGWTWNCKLSEHSCACCVALHGTFHSLDEILQDHVNGECMPLPYFIGMEPPRSGIDWFNKQAESLQRAILGTNVAFDLWQSGTPLESFIGVNHSDEYSNSVYQRSSKQIRKGEGG